ncbi:UDP-N-acetylmuramate dehydrogenase [bacterium]|nr:UDP-N-acetylmuramate dehydrogenase [bacterium]
MQRPTFIQENISLAELTTFKLNVVAEYFGNIATTDQLAAAVAWAKANEITFFILSGGSNTIFDGERYEGLVLHIDIRDYKLLDSYDDDQILEVGAGEDWDEVVARSIDDGLSGLELLSAIPGLCGSAPVQNIGAYGREFDQIFESLDALDTHRNELVQLGKDDCQFSYRTSIFKSTARGRYIITAVRMRLNRRAPDPPTYKDLVRYFGERVIGQPTAMQIREAVISIRQAKFPNPQQVPNVGSFFKNPIIDREHFERLEKTFPQINEPRPGWSQPARWFLPNDQVKIGAGWLIEELDLKGYVHGHVKVDDNHALVLENTGQASSKELLELRDIIVQRVYEKFQIKLEVEPDIVSSATSKPQA